MVEVTGLEPAASASRTQRSTKLSHTSKRNGGIAAAIVGCPTRIRTQTNRVRVCRATLTQSGNEFLSRTILYYSWGKSQEILQNFPVVFEKIEKAP